MCEKLVPQKGTFFCADKARCPLRQHLFIPHIWVESFVPLHPPYGTTLVCFSRCEDAKSVSKKIILLSRPLRERRNFLANVMSLEISERGKINCLNYFIFRRLLELFKIFPLRDSTHLTSLVREEILFYSRL